MSRPVTPDEADLVPSPEHWESERATFRLVRRAGDGMPDESDLRELHEVLEGAFVDHFNSREETFEEFLHRLREDPGHRWDHWWLAEIPGDDGDPEPVGALIGTVSESTSGPDGSYVSYLGVLESARGRGVAKGLLHTIIADAAGTRPGPRRPRGRRRLIHRRRRALHRHGLGDVVRHRVVAPRRAGRLRLSGLPRSAGARRWA